MKESTVEVMNIISDVVKQNARYAEAPTKSWDMDEEPINHGFCRASPNTARLSSNFLHQCDFFNFNKLSTKIRSLGAETCMSQSCVHIACKASKVSAAYVCQSKLVNPDRSFPLHLPSVSLDLGKSRYGCRNMI